MTYLANKADSDCVRILLPLWPPGGEVRLLQGPGEPDGVGDVASRDEALLRPRLPAEVLLPAERAHHGDAEGPREQHAGYEHPQASF